MSYVEINKIFDTPPTCFANGQKYTYRYQNFGIELYEQYDDNWQLIGIKRTVYHLRYRIRTTSEDSGDTLSFLFQSTNNGGYIADNNFTSQINKALQDGFQVYCAISKSEDAFIDLSNVNTKYKATLTKNENTDTYNLSCQDIYFPDYFKPNSIYYLWIFPEYEGEFSALFGWEDNSFTPTNLIKSYSITNPNTYTISFHGNGGAVTNLPSTQSCSVGLSTTIPTTVPQREGYTFQGWATSPFSLPTYYPGSTIKPITSQTLYAIWSLNGLMTKRYKAYIRQPNGSGKPYKVLVRTDNAGHYSYYKPTIGAASLKMAIQSEKNACEPGNIFYDKDSYDLNLYIQKNDNAAQYIYYKILVMDLLTNETKINYTSGKTSVLANSSRKIALSDRLNSYLTTQYGIFKIVASVYDENQVELNSIDYVFCRVKKATPNPYIGMNLHIPHSAIIAQNILKLAKNTGTSIWRISIPWETAEKVKNQYEIPVLAASAITYAKNNGLEPLIILAYGNDLYGENNPNDINWLNGYTNYCQWIINTLYQQYGIKYFEVWNEWNANMGKVPVIYRGGDQYAQVLCAVNDKINTSIRSKIMLVGGSVAGAVEEWMGELTAYNNGEAINKMDIFSFHTYPLVKNDSNISVFTNPTAYNYTEELAKINKLLPNKPIWLTETGWPTHEGTSLGYEGVSEEKQAAYLVQLYIQMMAVKDKYNIQNICWYDMMNDGTDITSPQDNFGLLHSYLENDATAYIPKQGYLALSAMCSILQGAQFIGDDTTYLWKLSDGSIVKILWNNNGVTSYSFDGNYTIDMFGNENFFFDNDTVRINYKPVYIVYD